MDIYQFIKLNKPFIENIDGCLTEESNITIYKDGKFGFYYFKNTLLVKFKS
jgi:hypothetical protein